MRCRLFLIFLDGREVDGAEAADLVGDVAQCFFPGVHVGFRRHLLIHGRQLEAGRGELFLQRLTPHLQFLSEHAHVFQTIARFFDRVLAIQALLIHRAHQMLGAFQRFACDRQFLLDVDALFELRFELQLQTLPTASRHRRVAEVSLSLRCANCSN